MLAGPLEPGEPAADHRLLSCEFLEFLIQPRAALTNHFGRHPLTPLKVSADIVADFPKYRKAWPVA